MIAVTEIINFTCDKCCISCKHDKKKCIARKLRSKDVNRAKYHARKRRKLNKENGDG